MDKEKLEKELSHLGINAYDVIGIIERELRKRDKEWKKREEYSVLLAFNIAGYPEAKAKKQTEIIINT